MEGDRERGRGDGYKKKPGELTKRKKEGDRKRSVTSYTACSRSGLVTVGKKTEWKRAGTRARERKSEYDTHRGRGREKC